MPLDKMEIRVPFGGGVDTKTDHKQVIPGQLLELKNGTFQNLKQITKREGFLSPWSLNTVDGDTIEAGWAVYRRGWELLCTAKQTNTDTGRVSWEDGNCMYSHDPGDDEWKKIGTREPLSLDVETVYRSSGLWLIPDVALDGTKEYSCYAWISQVDQEVTNRYVHTSVLNLANDSTVIDNWVYIGAAVQDPGGVHVVGIGDYFYVWIAVPGDIYMSSINVNTLSAAGNPLQKKTDLHDDMLWDVCTSFLEPWSFETSVLAYKENVNGHINVVWFDGGNQVDIDTIAEVPKGAICVFDAYDHITTTNKVVVAWQSNANGHLRMQVYNRDASVYTAAQDIYAADAGNVRNMTGCKDSAADHYNWPGRSYLRFYAETEPSVNPCENNVYQVQCEFDGGNPLQLNTMHRCCLASKAWEHDSKARVWVVHDSYGSTVGIPPDTYTHPEIQNTYFLRSTQGNYDAAVKGEDRTDARCLQGAAHGESWGQSLSAVVSPATDHYLFAGQRKDFIYKTNTGFTYDSIVAIAVQYGEVAQPSTELGPCVQTGGGFIGHADGRFQELNFHLFPECLHHSESGGTSGTPIDRQYCAIYEWTDREGQLHRSAPSQVYTAELTHDNSQVTIWISNLHQGDYDRLEEVRIILYRSVSGVFYRLTELWHRFNDPTVNYSAIIDPPDADAQITDNETLYTGTVQSGLWDIVPNICPPASSVMNVRQDRVFLVPDEDRTNIWFSKLKRHGVGVSFSDYFTKRVSDGGDITALIAMDGREIVFKEGQIRAFSGAGPIDTGVGSFGEDYLVTSDVGCVDRASVVWTDKGIMFKSLKGIYLLGRNLQVTYIGAPVEAYNQYKVLKAELVETKNQVRFLLEGANMLVYDYLVNQWSVFEPPQAGEDPVVWRSVDSAMWQNQYIMINMDGPVFVEDTGYQDVATDYIPLDLTTSWIKLNGLQGYQRVWWISLLGEVYDFCTINFEIYYDYVDANPQTGSVVVDANFAANPPAQFRIKPRIGNGKCQSFKIRLYDATAAGASNYKGFAISDLMIQIGKKPGVMRQGTLKTR